MRHRINRKSGGVDVLLESCFQAFYDLNLGGPLSGVCCGGLSDPALKWFYTGINFIIGCELFIKARSASSYLRVTAG